MPRVKEFDEAEVLDQALELFRARGFKHTSFNDLVEELGVSRQSLYDTYGNKEALYHQALKRYLTRALDQMRRALEGDDRPLRESLAALFEHMIAGQCAKASPGCLMVNSMVELSPHDADVRALAQEHARSTEGLFASRFAAAQRRGEIAKAKDPVALARYFYHTMLGLAVASRALGDRDGLRQSAQLALHALD
ncbi:MAG: TetR/AcrR family transcriptional regulator [Candidatus Didemnitutus sp.]|nr:TetR/AcrR family transcriptional regulator [Candidatus Didemnitutus sp.]